jgi:hypothetical protein
LKDAAFAQECKALSAEVKKQFKNMPFITIQLLVKYMP